MTRLVLPARLLVVAASHTGTDAPLCSPKVHPAEAQMQLLPAASLARNRI